MAKVELSRKAALLLAMLSRRGGGILDEYLLRDGTGLSHGSIVAARRELVAGGWLQLGKRNRKLVYILTGQSGAEPPAPSATHGTEPLPAGALSTRCEGPAPRAVSEGSALPPPEMPQGGLEPEDEDTGFARLIEPIEHVTGRFASLDEWTDALIDTLGGNIDITESLVEDGSYEIHSYDHQSDDHYQVTATRDGILVE